MLNMEIYILYLMKVFYLLVSGKNKQMKSTYCLGGLQK